MQGKLSRFFIGKIPRFRKRTRRQNDADRGRLSMQYLAPLKCGFEAGLVVVRPDNDMTTAKRTCICLSYSVGASAPGKGSVFWKESERRVRSLFSFHEKNGGVGLFGKRRQPVERARLRKSFPHPAVLSGGIAPVAERQNDFASGRFEAHGVGKRSVFGIGISPEL